MSDMHIVTGFVGGINSRKDRDLAKYVSLGKELLSVEIATTCFLEKGVWTEFVLPFITSPIREEAEFVYVCKGGVMDGMRSVFRYVVCGHVRFVFFEREQLFLWPYQALASAFSLHTGNPEKDTLGYMMVQCQKVEWMNIATCLTPHLLNEYVWIDFGSFHMFHGSVDRFQGGLCKLRERICERVSREGRGGAVVRMAGCWQPYVHRPGDIYRDINWTFAGSLFGGGGDAIREFACRMREKCFRILREKNHLMWEINVWVLIFLDCPDLFSWFRSDHSPILFDGYH